MKTRSLRACPRIARETGCGKRDLSQPPAGPALTAA